MSATDDDWFLQAMTNDNRPPQETVRPRRFVGNEEARRFTNIQGYTCFRLNHHRIIPETVSGKIYLGSAPLNFYSGSVPIQIFHVNHEGNFRFAPIGQPQFQASSGNLLSHWGVISFRFEGAEPPVYSLVASYEYYHIVKSKSGRVQAAKIDFCSMVAAYRHGI